MIGAGDAVRILGAALGILMLAARADAQEHTAHVAPSARPASAEIAEFVAAAARGTERYRDRRVAIAAGFRRLGGDFPSMGEHWAHPGKVIAGRFDVSDPAMLTYASIDGKPVLLGVVYAIPLEQGENAPSLPGGAKAWHEHNGTVDEESFLPEHGGDHSAERGTRLAILHVWTVLPNPAGDFVAENWALPFARLNLKTPGAVPEAAARALSLLSGSAAFYSDLLEAELQPESRGDWRAALAAAKTNALEIVGDGSLTDTLSNQQLQALERTWLTFLAGVSKHDPAAASRLGGGGTGAP